jgi:hypothetical protein
MTRFSMLAAFLGAVLSQACAADSNHDVEAPAPLPIPESAEAADELRDASLQALAALEVFEVGNLVTDLPDNSFHCYGLCPEHLDEYLEAVSRLAAFAGAAVDAAGAADLAACPTGAIAGNLGAIADLRVVEVGAFLAAEPENNPQCYNLPCPEDVAAAEATNCERAAKLDAIVARSVRD